MDAEATKTKSKMLSTMVILGSVQALILLVLILGGHVERNVRDLVLIYVCADTLVIAFRNQLGFMRHAGVRAALYSSPVVLLIAYAIIVNALRTALPG